MLETEAYELISDELIVMGQKALFPLINLMKKQ